MLVLDSFHELSILIILVVAVSIIIRLFRQPLILGYILAGVIAGPYALDLVKSHETLELVSEIGITILLFIIGLGLNPKVVKEVGKVSLITGTGKVICATVAGFAIGRAFGYDTTASIYIGIAISFSSTIIIMKLLADKKELDQLYGRISIGFLLVEDVLASLVLIGIASSTQGGSMVSAVVPALAKLSIILAVFYLLARYVLPSLAHFMAKSKELLSIFSIAWALGIAALVKEFGLSIEIGGLLAGVAFAGTHFAREMGTRLQPIRDFFLVIFFILLGAQIAVDNMAEVIVPVLVLSVVVLIGNPLVIMTFMRFFGHNKKTNFKAGLAGAQISEFSLIVVVLAEKVGQVSTDVVSIITMTALITIAGSSYFIIYSDALYIRLERLISIFEKKGSRSSRRHKAGFDVLVLGSNSNLLDDNDEDMPPQQHGSYLIVDHDPTQIHELKQRGMEAEYGDITDVEFLNELHLEQTKLIISNIKTPEKNILILYHAAQYGFDGVYTVTAPHPEAAAGLYRAGADYVEITGDAGAKVAASLVRKYGVSKSDFNDVRKLEMSKLKLLSGIGILSLASQLLHAFIDVSVVQSLGVALAPLGI